MIKPSYVITIAVNGASESSVWNSEKPLQIGHPFRWIAEKTENGIRVRNVTSTSEDTAREVTDVALQSGASIELPEVEQSKSSGFTLALRPVVALPNALKTHGKEAGELRVYELRGDWTLDSSALDGHYDGYVQGKRAFEIRRASGGGYKIQSLIDSIRFGTASLEKAERITVTDHELAGTTLTSGEFKWRFATLKRVGLNPIPTAAKIQDAETIAFRRSFKTACGAIAIFALFALFWPKPQTEAPIPPQFTKMLLKKPMKMYASAAAMGHASDISYGSTPSKHARGSSHKKIQVAKVVHKAPGHPRHTAVAHAHSKPKMLAKAAPKPKAVAKTERRSPPAAQTVAKAIAKRTSTKSALTSKLVAKGPIHTVVQPSHQERDTQLAKTLADPGFVSASHSLVKSGMTKLLANKGYDDGSDAHAAAKGMFKSGSHGGSLGGANSLGTRSVEVASIGGEAGLFSGNGGVGYGKGSHARVSGQGKNFVALDTGKSEVEEGLTKEQVGAVIHAHMSEIRYCYEAAQLRDPELSGKLSVAFVVGAPGRVNTAHLAQASSPEQALGECLVSRLKGWQFPHPLGGVNVAVNYPFIFKILGR
jgi:hypothetical protein